MGNRSPSQGGFTLLELLVALTIFGLVSTMAYGGLQTVLETRSRVEAEGQRLSDLQLALGVFARDLRQHIELDWRDSWGERHPSLRLDPLAARPRLELVTAGGRLGAQRSELRRVAYELDDGVLYRLLWTTLDGSGETPNVRSRLAGRTEQGRAHIEEIEYTFYYRPQRRHTASTDPEVETLDYWPVDPALGPTGVLLAVEIALTLGGGERVYRLFPVQRAGTASPTAGNEVP